MPRTTWLALLLLAAPSFAAEREGASVEAAYEAIPGMKEYVGRISQAKDRIGAVTGDPAKFVTEQTYLKDPATFRAFLKNRAAMDGFLNDSVTRYIVEHGWAVKELARPSVVKAVIGSPAMRDRRLVSYLFTKTALPLRLSRAPGVKEALNDRAFVEALCTPELKGWLSANPAAEAALKAQSGPLAELLARR